jgi:hypothetical protein
MLIKNAIYLFLGLHEEPPGYRRSLCPKKRISSTSKHEISKMFIFVALPGFGSTDLIQSGSESLFINSTV